MAVLIVSSRINGVVKTYLPEKKKGFFKRVWDFIKGGLK